MSGQKGKGKANPKGTMASQLDPDQYIHEDPAIHQRLNDELDQILDQTTKWNYKMIDDRCQDMWQEASWVLKAYILTRGALVDGPGTKEEPGRSLLSARIMARVSEFRDKNRGWSGQRQDLQKGKGKGKGQKQPSAPWVNQSLVDWLATQTQPQNLQYLPDDAVPRPGATRTSRWTASEWENWYQQQYGQSSSSWSGQGWEDWDQSWGWSQDEWGQGWYDP